MTPLFELILGLTFLVLLAFYFVIVHWKHKVWKIEERLRKSESENEILRQIFVMTKDVPIKRT